ncbi:hypothetical protein [Neisseria weaveri]|uniref:hypothetical protein n=1 Tax=Neisseria weaveri TaxID=28091 RepID=UPI000D2F56B8|nr:hypothetical protein [Neisseria weaveri]
MNGTRWWENYLVRYLVPSILGMVILMWLSKEFSTVATYLQILPFDKYEKFNTAHLVGWLLFGTVYCYIASYPILVFHAIRVRLFRDQKTNAVNCRTVVPLAVFSSFVFVSAWIVSLNDKHHIDCAAFVMAISLLGFSVYQICNLYWVSLTDKKENGFSYAEVLTKARTRKGAKDFVDSYKHLREHGNTALIILLEILLAAVLYVALSFESHYKRMHFSIVAIVLFVWIAPAALVYFYGQFLERKLSQF